MAYLGRVYWKGRWRLLLFVGGRPFNLWRGTVPKNHSIWFEPVINTDDEEYNPDNYESQCD